MKEQPVVSASPFSNGT